METCPAPPLILNHGATGSDASSGSTLRTVWEVRMEWKKKAKGSLWGLKRRDQAGVGRVTEPESQNRN